MDVSQIIFWVVGLIIVGFLLLKLYQWFVERQPKKQDSQGNMYFREDVRRNTELFEPKDVDDYRDFKPYGEADNDE